MSDLSLSSNESASDGEDAADKRHQGTSWVDVGFLMLSDIVGTSVLTFAGVARQLGSVLTATFIAGLFPVSLYVSMRMASTRTLVLKTAVLRNSGPPRVDTMGEVASQLLRHSRAAGVAVHVAVYGFTVLGQASYLLVLGTSLQDAFFSQKVCIYAAVAIGCMLLLVPVFAVRKLGESVLLCFGNVLLLVTLLVIALTSIARRGRPACAEAYAFAPGLTLLGALGAATNVVYSYAGQWMYFEMMESMAVPQHFPRAVAVTGPIMLAIFSAVAFVAHHYAVQKDDIMQDLQRNDTLRVASAMLFVHVMIVYLIKSIVIQQYLHRLCSPADVDQRTLTSYVKHGVAGAAMLLLGFLVANAVPFFSQLLGLIGGLLAGPINFLFPLYLFLAARGRHAQAADQAEGASSGGESGRSDGLGAAWQRSSVWAACDGLRQLGTAELSVIAVVFLFITATMILGVTDVLKQIVELNSEFGAPFTCHALPPVDDAVPGANSYVCR